MFVYCGLCRGGRVSRGSTPPGFMKEISSRLAGLLVRPTDSPGAAFEGGRIMAIVRWDPFHEMADMQDRMGRLLGEFYGRRGADDVMRRGAWIPPVDIYEDGNQRARHQGRAARHEARGHPAHRREPDAHHQRREEDGRRTCTRRTATASSGRTAASRGRSRCRRRWTRRRSSADYKSGVLTVRLPLREEAKPKQIQVKVSE